MNSCALRIAAAVALICCSVASADQVVFKDGDKIIGKIASMEGGKMKITSSVAGEIIVDMNDVATFSTDEPIAIQTNDGKTIHEPVATAESGQVKPEQGEALPL